MVGKTGFVFCFLARFFPTPQDYTENMEPRFNRPLTPAEELPPLSGWRRTFAALRNVNYRCFYGGQTLSLIGTWARSAAWGWMAFQLTHSEFWTGFIFMLNSLPILLFSIYAGSLADRVPKLKIFKITSWLALTASLTLAILLFRGSVSISLLMVFVAFWGLAMAFEMPAR
jgi:MFS family permease